MTTVNIHAAKTRLSRLVPLAAMKAEAPKAPRALGLLKGSLVLPDDVHAPLPDDMLARFEGG